MGGGKLLVLVVLAIIGVVLLSLYGKFGPVLLDMNRLTKYFQYFVFGLLAMRYNSIYKRTMHNEWLKAIAILAFFALLFTINRPIWPTSMFHLLRDLVLRYLGTFMVVSVFLCRFDADTRANRVVFLIGKKSLAIYLLQYFFIPSFLAWPEWIAKLDGFTIHIIAFAYTLVIILICLIFISLISYSSIVKRYVLGQKE